MNTARKYQKQSMAPGVFMDGLVRRGGTVLLAIVCTVFPAAWLVLPVNAAAEHERCALCSPNLAVPVIPITAAWLDSMAQAHASFNAKQLERIDSLLQTGHYGPSNDVTARQTAHLVARLSTINAYRDLVRMACDSTRVYEADEATLRDLYARYSDVNLFIDSRLEHIRIGLGHVCMRYNLDEKAEGVSDHGGKQLRWRVRDIKIEGCKRRVLDLIFPTGADDEVEIYLAAHHTFRVEYKMFAGPPAPYEWFLVRDIEGAWLRKWGTHRPTAYMFWVSASHATPPAPTTGMNYLASSGQELPSSEPSLDLPSTPLVGLRIYIPGLKLKLPLLPDVNVDDLREVELPMPILDLEYIRQNQQPSWLDVNANLGFTNWEQYGALPPEIRREFPDL
jgi:hypothetical protein